MDNLEENKYKIDKNKEYVLSIFTNSGMCLNIPKLKGDKVIDYKVKYLKNEKLEVYNKVLGNSSITFIEWNEMEEYEKNKKKSNILVPSNQTIPLRRQ